MTGSCEEPEALSNTAIFSCARLFLPVTSPSLGRTATEMQVCRSTSGTQLNSTITSSWPGIEATGFVSRVCHSPLSPMPGGELT